MDSTIYLTIHDLPVWAIIGIALCFVGIIASGKAGEVFTALVLSVVGYALYTYFVVRGAFGDIMLESIPFSPYVFNNLGNHFPYLCSVKQLFLADFGVFSQELFKLFLLVLFITGGMEFVSSIFTAIKGSGNARVSFPAGLLAKYIFGILFVWLYYCFYKYVVIYIPSTVMAIIVNLVMLALLLMLLSPLVNFLILSAKIVPHPVISKLASFVKTFQLGGTMQCLFYVTFSIPLLIMILQETGLWYMIHNF